MSRSLKKGPYIEVSLEKKILATVAGRDITVGDIDNVIASYSPEEQAKMQNETVRAKILEQLIATRLFAMEAREKGLDKTKSKAELKKERERARKIKDGIN